MPHIVAHLVPCCRHSFGRVQSYTPSFAPWQNTTCAHAISQNCRLAWVWICGNGNISAFFVSTKNGNERKRTETNGEIAPVTHRYPPLVTVIFSDVGLLPVPCVQKTRLLRQIFPTFCRSVFSAKTKRH